MKSIPLNPCNIPDLNLNAFLEANGLDPHEVVAGQVATVEDNRLTVTVVVFDDDGKAVRNNFTHELVKRTKSVPLISAPENFGL